MKYSAVLLLLPMLGLVACKPQAVEPTASAETSPAPAAEVAAADDYPAVLQAAGTEPFWGVRVDGAGTLRILNSRPDHAGVYTCK